MFRRHVVVPVLMILAGVGTAQRRTQKPESPRVLTEAQVEQRLEELKSGLLLQVMPENKKRRGELQQRRWLESFYVVQSDHYLMFTNASKTMGRKFSKGMEDIYEFVQEQFPFEDKDTLLTCYVFNMAEEYHNFCVVKAGWPLEQAERTGGHAHIAQTVDGFGPSYYATHYQSPTADVVTHEASHQLVLDCLQITGMGSWFDEGIATYLEKIKAKDKPSAAMRTDLRNGEYVPLDEYFAMRSMAETPWVNASIKSDPRLLVQRNYTHAGALIDFLANTKLEPVAGKFPEFLAMAKEQRYRPGSAATVKVLREVYGLSPSELEKLWKQHHGLRDR